MSACLCDGVPQLSLTALTSSYSDNDTKWSSHTDSLSNSTLLNRGFAVRVVCWGLLFVTLVSDVHKLYARDYHDYLFAQLKRMPNNAGRWFDPIWHFFLPEIQEPWEPASKMNAKWAVEGKAPL